MKRKLKWIWALLMSLALLTTQHPLAVMAESKAVNIVASAGSEEEIPEIVEENEEENTALADVMNSDANKQVTSNEPAYYADKTILEVTFDDNDNYNSMRDAIDDAEDKISDVDKIETIRLTGTATELSGNNWDYLRNMYRQSNYQYGNLSSLDLSGLDRLTRLAKEGQRSSTSTKLQKVIFPDSLQILGKNAFQDCKMLSSPTLPTSLKAIEKDAFRGCSSLTELVFPDGLEVIGSAAFQECSALNQLTFKDALEKIEDYAFAFCSNLPTVSLPRSLQTIGNFTFQNCASLTSFTVDADNQYYSAADGVLYDKSETKLLVYPCGKTDSSFAVPDTVHTIEGFAFYECNPLNTLMIPENLTTINPLAIYNCSNLSSITVDNDNQAYSSEDGVLYNKDQTTLLLYPQAKSGTSFRVPTGVNSIGEAAFRNCSGLSTIILAESVNYFGYSVFSYCSSLNLITFLSDTPPTEEDPGYNGTFTDVPDTGTIYYPAASANYTEKWKNDIELSNWSLTPAYRLEVESGTDMTNTGLYADGASVEIKADAPPAGQRFDKWIMEGAGTFDDDSNEQTTFIISDQNTKVTATYRDNPPPHHHTFGEDWLSNETHHWKTCIAGDGAQSNYEVHTYGDWTADNETGTSSRKCTVCGYEQTERNTRQTLTDPDTNVTVSGYFTSDAALSVQKAVLHEDGTCPVCDEIRAREAAGELIALYDISLSSGIHNGEVEISFPVDGKYNGQTLVLLHCMDRQEERREEKAAEGFVTGTFTGLSPFAVLETTKVQSVKLTPSSLTLELGKSRQLQADVSPANAYDKKVTWKTSNKKIATVSASGLVKAVKAGTATITCTAADGGAKATCKVTVQNTATPLILLKGTAGKNSVRLNWNRISNADGYEIYGSRCGGSYSYKKLKTVTKGTAKTWTQNNLKSATAYKYYIKAYKQVNGRKLYLRVSKTSHVVTTGGKYTNVRSVATTFTDITLAKGKTRQISARVTPVKKGAKLANHVPEFRYKTTNSKVAAVTASGKIKAAGKGRCSVYVYANNGVTKRIKITVK